MRKLNKVIPLQELLDEDLDAVCADLKTEFGQMSGGKLLITGGVLSPEDAKTHARRNVVTNVIGGPSAGVERPARSGAVLRL